MHANDLVLTSALVYITGGAQSPYMFLYALSVVSAGALSYRRGAVVVTVASLASAIVVSLVAWSHAIDLPLSAQVRPWEQTGAELVRTLGINVAALIGVGALSYIFGDQLQRGAETLATTRRAAADLLTLHQDILRSLSSGLVTTMPRRQDPDRQPRRRRDPAPPAGLARGSADRGRLARPGAAR